MSGTTKPLQGPSFGAESGSDDQVTPERAPVHFTARLQHPLRLPSRPSRNNVQLLSLFRNPFNPRQTPGSQGGRPYTPNIYNEFEANHVVYSQVHEGIMKILVHLYSDALAEDFDVQFRQPKGGRNKMHLILSGSLSEVGVVDIEDCHIASGRFQVDDNSVWIEE